MSNPYDRSDVLRWQAWNEGHEDGVSELDAALAERDEARNDATFGSAAFRAEYEAVSTELAELRAKAQTMGVRLRQWAEREQECISAACAFNDPASPGHSPDCPAAPDYLTQPATEGDA